MILADTSVWIDHFRNTNQELSDLLIADRLCIHPFIIEEIACGNLANRESTIDYLSSLRQIPVSSHSEVMELIKQRRIFGSGLGSVDANLIASCLFAGAELFTLDKNLAQVWARCKP
ncbi:MAG: PIN domain-containing protein [Spirochaetes bacterium]|nr:PIN domain-containing protein [Spirochaetota bacterium]